MSVTKQAFFGCQIFDGIKRHADSALLIDADRVVDIVAENNIPDDYSKLSLAGGMIFVGFRATAGGMNDQYALGSYFFENLIHPRSDLLNAPHGVEAMV